MSAFKSFASEQLEEAKAVGEVERLFEEHAKSRELATLANNMPASLDEHNAQFQQDLVAASAPAALPELTDADKVRLGKIMNIIKGPHTKAVLKVVRRYMPDLFASPDNPSS